VDVRVNQPRSGGQNVAPGERAQRDGDSGMLSGIVETPPRSRKIPTDREHELIVLSRIDTKK